MAAETKALWCTGVLMLFLCIPITAEIHRQGIVGSIQNGKIKIEIGEGYSFLHVVDKSGNIHTINATCNQLAKESTLPDVTKTTNVMFVATWPSGLQLTVTALPNGYHGFTYRWETFTEDYIEVSIDLGQYNWYGGPERYVQQWTVQNETINETDFLPNEVNGGVVERYFLSSEGIAYFIDPSIPVFLSIKNHTINFKAEFKSPYRNTDGRPLHFQLSGVTGGDLVDTHLDAVNLFLGKPSGIPLDRMFRLPIWSTWAIYKAPINQSIVLTFADDILENKFPNSQFEIDDNWETCYGSELFNPNTFPNPKEMVSTLKSKGFDVTIWVHPFCNLNCPTYVEGDQKKYLATSDGYNETGVTEWWNGKGGIIDVTRPQASQWWADRLNNLRNDIGITSFKFDAGETHFLPHDAYLFNVSEDLQPGMFSTDYVAFASQFGEQIEVRTGYRSQEHPIFVRLLDRDSGWGLNNGLHSVLTSTLHYGIIGYPFVLPDMIGGNAYQGEFPDRELYIRWMQLNAFLPSIQFSIPPWVYDNNVTEIAHEVVTLHANITDIIILAAQEATITGSPIIRPLWWIAPDDPVAQVINDQFLVANEILVAPILEAGARKRDIYLPHGIWIDMLHGGTHEGPMWLHEYEVQLSEIAYFINLPKKFNDDNEL